MAKQSAQAHMWACMRQSRGKGVRSHPDSRIAQGKHRSFEQVEWTALCTGHGVEHRCTHVLCVLTAV